MEDLAYPALQGEVRSEEPIIQKPPTSISTIDEHDLYPVHEEDSVPVIPQHFWQNNYLAYAIQMYHSDFWVVGDTCLYWERGSHSPYRAPDVTVISGTLSHV